MGTKVMQWLLSPILFSFYFIVLSVSRKFIYKNFLQNICHISIKTIYSVKGLLGNWDSNKVTDSHYTPYNAFVWVN